MRSSDIDLKTGCSAALMVGFVSLVLLAFLRCVIVLVYKLPSLVSLIISDPVHGCFVLPDNDGVSVFEVHFRVVPFVEPKGVRVFTRESDSQDGPKTKAFTEFENGHFRCFGRVPKGLFWGALGRPKRAKMTSYEASRGVKRGVLGSWGCLIMGV